MHLSRFEIATLLLLFEDYNDLLEAETGVGIREFPHIQEIYDRLQEAINNYLE